MVVVCLDDSLVDTAVVIVVEAVVVFVVVVPLVVSVCLVVSFSVFFVVVVSSLLLSPFDESTMLDDAFYDLSFFEDESSPFVSVKRKIAPVARREATRMIIAVIRTSDFFILKTLLSFIFVLYR